MALFSQIQIRSREQYPHCFGDCYQEWDGSWHWKRCPHLPGCNVVEGDPLPAGLFFGPCGNWPNLELGETLARIRSLKVVDIIGSEPVRNCSWSHFEKVSDCLFRSLSTNNELETLRIWGTISKLAIGELAESLMHNDKLLNLHVLARHDDGLDGKCLAVISRALPFNRTLLTLSLSVTHGGWWMRDEAGRCEWEKDEAFHLALGQLVQSSVHLRCLSLGFHELWDDDCLAVASSLEHNTSIERLEIVSEAPHSPWHLNSASVHAVARALAQNCTLKHFLFDCLPSNLTSNTCEAIAVTLKVNLSLESLCLHVIKFNDSPSQAESDDSDAGSEEPPHAWPLAGLIANIQEALDVNTTLQVLHLHTGSGWDSEVLRADEDKDCVLFQQLSRNCHLPTEWRKLLWIAHCSETALVRDVLSYNPFRKAVFKFFLPPNYACVRRPKRLATVKTVEIQETLPPSVNQESGVTRDAAANPRTSFFAVDVEACWMLQAGNRAVAWAPAWFLRFALLACLLAAIFEQLLS